MPVYKSPLEQANALAPETTRSKWNRYLKNGFKGNPRTIDKYNRLIAEIEGELPFENEKEHKKWSDLGATWMGEAEWPDMTENLLQRSEAKPLNFGPKDIDKILKENPYANDLDWGRSMDYLSGQLGVEIPENVSQVYRKNNYIYGVEGQPKGEPIDKILFKLGGK